MLRWVPAQPHAIEMLGESDMEEQPAISAAHTSRRTALGAIAKAGLSLSALNTVIIIFKENSSSVPEYALRRNVSVRKKVHLKKKYHVGKKKEYFMFFYSS